MLARSESDNAVACSAVTAQINHRIANPTVLRSRMLPQGMVDINALAQPAILHGIERIYCFPLQ